MPAAFFFYSYGDLRDLHSFPTRRSSDLSTACSRSPCGTVRGAGCSAPATASGSSRSTRSEEHTSELQSSYDLVCRLLLEKKKRSVQPARPSASHPPARPS